jgi:hypothetical protein
METTPQFCSLYKIPIEILNQIASYLTFTDRETEIEFIERTEKMEAHKLEDKQLSLLPMQNPSEQEVLYSSCCPDNKIIAILQCFNNSLQGSSLTLINKVNNTVLYAEHLGLKTCSNVTASRNGSMIAFAAISVNNSNYSSDFAKCLKEELIVKNINLNEEMFFNIPYTFILRQENPAIAFNKQGTHIIIHGSDSEKLKTDLSLHHIIFPLTTTATSDDINKKTLAKYFMQRRICKDLLQQITQ